MLQGGNCVLVSEVVDLVAVSFGEVWALVYLYTLLFVTTLFYLCLPVSYYLVVLAFLFNVFF